MKQAPLVKVTVISIDGETAHAGVKVINAYKICGTPYTEGSYTVFGYDEKHGDRRDRSKRYVVSDALATINSYVSNATLSNKVLTDITCVTKGSSGEISFAKTSGFIVKNIISAEANRTTATYTDIKYEVDAFEVEKVTVNLTLANLIKYANTPNFEYWDDFVSIGGALGTAIATAVTLQDYYWDVSTSTSGTVTETAEADPFYGKLLFDTTATGSRTAIAAWRTAIFNGAFEKTFKARFATSNITNTEIKIGWFASANDYCYLNFDTATNAANLYLATNNNNAGVQRDDSGVDLVAATAVDVSITIKGTSIIALVNGTKVTITNCSVRDLDTFKPYIYVDNKAAAEQKLLGVDFVGVSQYRV